LFVVSFQGRKPAFKALMVEHMFVITIQSIHFVILLELVRANTTLFYFLSCRRRFIEILGSSA
jgi:hypothetical protein